MSNGEWGSKEGEMSNEQRTKISEERAMSREQ
jgi:hypothetical protein